MVFTSLDATRDTIEPHDHAVVVYEREEELVRPLGRFIEEGIERNELMVFIHAFDREEAAWDLLTKAHPGARNLASDRLVVINYYKEAFEKECIIDYEHVGAVIGTLQTLQADGKRSGIRVFVDASRQYITARRLEEWFAFESWLGARLQAEMGLVCAYPKQNILDPDVLAQVLRTHSYRFDPPARSP